MISMTVSDEVAYISGPMSGKPNFNRTAFFDVEWCLGFVCQHVINPARLPDGLDYKTYMDIAHGNIRAAGVIVQLPGWRDSTGAIQERCWAYEMGKKVVEL